MCAWQRRRGGQPRCSPLWLLLSRGGTADWRGRRGTSGVQPHQALQRSGQGNRCALRRLLLVVVAMLLSWEEPLWRSKHRLAQGGGGGAAPRCGRCGCLATSVARRAGRCQQVVQPPRRAHAGGMGLGRVAAWPRSARCAYRGRRACHAGPVQGRPLPLPLPGQGPLALGGRGGVRRGSGG